MKHNTSPMGPIEILTTKLLGVLIIGSVFFAIAVYSASNHSTHKSMTASAMSHLEAEGFTDVEILGVSTEDCMPYHEIGFRFKGIFPLPTQENIEGFVCAEKINGEWEWDTALLAYDPNQPN